MATTTAIVVRMAATTIKSAAPTSTKISAGHNGILSGEDPSIYNPSNPVSEKHQQLFRKIVLMP